MKPIMIQEEKKREAADVIAKNGRPLSQAGDDEDLGWDPGQADKGKRLQVKGME